MKNDKRSPGFSKNTSLGTRMKEYEGITTNISLIPSLPIYARIDGRAFHTFCRGLKKPFDISFVDVMKDTTKYLIAKTNATMGYVQSDEISLVWLDDTKVPFGTRLFKLQSVLSSIATTAFIMYGLKTSLKDRIEKLFPTFDCRVFNLPSLDECSNMILWRERDCMKNSITLVSLDKFSDKQIHKKNSDEKIAMLKDVGIDYRKDIPMYLQKGTYLRREVFEKILTDDELLKIPENQRKFGDDGKMRVVRSDVFEFNKELFLGDIQNKTGVLFNREEPLRKV